MYKIGIIDNDLNLLKNLKKYINSFSTMKCVCAIEDINSFYTKYQSKNRKLNILFLDILFLSVISPKMTTKLIAYFRDNKEEKTDFKTVNKTIKTITYHFEDFFSESKIYLNLHERKILQLLSEGNSYGMTAIKLGSKLDTLRYHIKKIYKKLHVNNKVDAVNFYHKEKI